MSKDDLVSRGEKINKLRKLLYHEGESVIASKLIADVVDTEMWREFIDPADFNKKTYIVFTEFCQRSLGFLPETLMDHVRNHPGLRARIYDLASRPAHRPKKDEAETLDNIKRSSVKPATGTSQVSGMRRLVKERPDLAEKVEAGELSVHAASKEAGFRKPTAIVRVDDAVAAVRPLLKFFTIDDLIAALESLRPK